MRQNYTLGTTFSVCKAGNNLVMIIILFVENVLSQCRRCSVVLFSEMKIYQIYVIRDERQKKYGNRLPVVEGVTWSMGIFWGNFGNDKDFRDKNWPKCI